VYKYSTPLILVNTTVVSCIITDGYITVNNFLTTLIDNIPMDEKSTIKQIYPVTFSLGQLYNNNMMDQTNIFKGTINHVLMYNAALSNKHYDKVVDYLLMYHKIKNNNIYNNNQGTFTW
jgi:hypothetical protein